MTRKYILRFYVSNPQGYGYAQHTGALEFASRELADGTGREYANCVNNRPKNVLQHDIWEFIESVETL